MKRILAVLAMITGAIAILVWAAPVGAKNIHILPYQGKQVVFEAQLINVALPFGCCDDCGGEVTVFTKKGETYVEFDFIAPPPTINFPATAHDYNLSMEVLFADETGRKEVYLGDECIDGEVNDTNRITVTTDENGECHTGPILIDKGLFLCGLLPPPYPDQIPGVTFSVKVVGWETPPPPVPGGPIAPANECGAWLSTGIK